MFLDEYDDEIFTKRMYKAIAEEAREEGWSTGNKAGLEAGRKAGLEAGLEAGLKAGTEKINCLNQFLLRDNRQDDLLKSISDPDFQKQLLEEYSLFSQDSSSST